jgi:hypothetical protein
MLHFDNNDSLKTIYFACFHYIMKYRIISSSNSSYCKNVFMYKRKLLQTLVGANL